MQYDKQRRTLSMSAQPNASSLEIRTFGSFEEIQALNQFEVNAPLNPANYKRLFGDYHLPEKVRCCVQKENGKLCEEPHNHGWLVERADGKLTLVGGDCGVNKFGADRRLMIDLSHYRNEKARQERIASLSEALTAKSERLGALGKMQADVKALESRMQKTTSQFGLLTARRLQDMVRTRRYEVFITATRQRTETDSNGHTTYENSSFQHRLGSLAALDLVTAGAFNALYDAVNDIVRAYELAETLIKEPDLRRKSKQVNAVAGRLQQYAGSIQEGQRLLDLERKFFENDFSLFCFLTKDKNERAKAAMLAMSRLGKKSEKIEPGNWLAKREANIKELLQVQSISIG
ncbi:hypothetical protein MKD49_06050 [Herbaspirillum sp. WGmk3]|uniref:hypothetical protein n=1 Tax=Herbaspirillum sp. WGmk3 TaxID=2919925 RepID=UPI0020909160|nr:hypothetical protein [Herbaspirillum sp. WGmk3]MCO4856043.1 hypothetical protein [Herbaspirillum sp. WGmk3]